MLNLDKISLDVFNWISSLYVEDNGMGSFKMGKEGQINLLSATDAAWLMYATNTVEKFPEEKKELWIKWLKNYQNPSDGSYAYTEAVGPKNMHSNGHAFWHLFRSLGILKTQLKEIPEYLLPVTSVEGLNSWFDKWEAQPNNTHHDVLGLIPILANINDPEWVKTFYSRLTGEQDAKSGTWLTPNGTTNISRTFAYNCMYAAGGLIPNHTHEMIDTILSLQAEDGLWHDSNHSYFSSMDSIYILSHLPKKTGYKIDVCQKALEKAARRMSEVYITENEQLKGNTHAMLSVVHALGLLQEAVPEYFECSKPWNFNWDNTSLFKSSVFESALKK